MKCLSVTVSWRNDNPNTIWNRLALRLGREPTNAEVRAELDRILGQLLVERAEAGKLPWQRRRAKAAGIEVIEPGRQG